jgi:tetratricopeptide (TPR) repeat protein
VSNVDVTRSWPIVILILLAACSSPKRPAVAPDPRIPERLAHADTLVRAGCLDCLVDAFAEYDQLRALPAAHEAATAGAIRAAGLIALRQRELGQVDEGYVRRARDLVAGSTGASESLAMILDVIEVLPASGAGVTRTPTSDVDLERSRILRINRDAWTAKLRELASADELGAYTWLSLMCGAAEARTMTLDDLLAPAAQLRDTPLIAYKRAVCRRAEVDRLDALYAENPRFVETRYHVGLALLGAQKLDDADKELDRAYAWRKEWPALTQTIANVAMTAEDFDRALTFYDRTLQLEPHAVDALLGRIRSLTYIGRHEDAIATTDVLIAEHWFVGDARYWRALNEAQLERYDEAWADVEDAAKLVINADVPKLAGLIAYRRGELEVSRAKFDLAQRRNQNDCETAYYLGVVLAELKRWELTAQMLQGAGTCLETAERAHLEEIASIRASSEPPERKAKKIARREQSIATERREMATSWFDIAVAYYNLARGAEARQYAERVLDDEQFGGRAKEILARLK